MDKNLKTSEHPEAFEKAADYTKIIVKNMVLDMSIGVHDFEKQEKQAVIVSVETTVANNPHWRKDLIDNTLNYESIVSAIKHIANRGHINLVETYAEYIADFCLSDPMIQGVKVCVEKPDIFEFADSVAVEIFRTK